MNRSDLIAHVDVLYHRCFRILKDRELAWDACQEAITRYFEASSKRNIDQPLHYLYRTSTNYCIDLLHRNAKTMPMDPDFMRQVGIKAHNQVESKMVVEHLLEQFGRDTMKLLIYRHIDQMTYGEIADVIGKSDRGVKKKLDRIASNIRNYLNG